MRNLCAVTIMLLAAVACSDGRSASTTPAADRVAIDQLHERHVQAARQKDVEAFVATVTDDVVLMPPNDPGARGTAAVRTWFGNMFGAYTITGLEFPTTELHIDRDWAVKHYTYDWTVSPVAAGEPIRDRGNGLYVYRRQADGSWRVAYDIWTSSQPAR